MPPEMPKIAAPPRRWKAAGSTAPYDPQLEPDDSASTPPHLIEPPVVVDRSDAAA